MSEQLLEAILQLFSMLASLDGVGEKERTKVYNLLSSRLNKEVVGKYLDLFDIYCKKNEEKEASLLDQIEKVTRKINGQITNAMIQLG